MGNRINDPASAGATPTDELSKRKPLFGESAFKSSPLLISSGTESDVQVDNFKESYKYLGNGAGGIDAPIETWKDTIPLRQSNWAQFGNATARTLLNILPETIKQGSRMLDFTGELDDNGFANDNAIAEAMTSIQNSVNDEFKIYRENSETPMDFGDFAYWMEQGSNLVQSAGAFALLGMATGGVGGAALKAGTAARRGLMLKRGIDAERLAVAGAEAVGAGTTGETIGQAVTSALRKTLSNNNINGVGNAFLMNRAEGVGVATDTYKSVYDKEKTELKAKQKENLLTDAQIEEQAKGNAAQAAAYAYNFNRVNILLNLSSSFAFVNVNSLGLRQSLEKTGLKETAKVLGSEALQEGAEETVNFVAQKRAEAGDYKLSAGEMFRNAVTEGSKEAFSEEGREAALWGAIGGLAQTGFTRASHYLKKEDNVNYQEAYRKHVSQIYRSEPDLTPDEVTTKAKTLAEQEVGSADKKISRNDIVEYKNRTLLAERAKIRENLGIVQGEDGDTYSKATNTTDLYLDAQEHLELDRQIQEARNNKDEATVKALSEKKFDFQVMRAMETGTLNTLEDSLKSIAAISPIDAVEYGIAENADDINYKQQAQKGLQTIKDFERIANYNQRYINSRDINALDIDTYRIAQKEDEIEKEIRPTINELLREKRDNFFSTYVNKSFVPYVSDMFYQKTYEDKQEELRALTPEKRTYVNERTKELDNDVKLTQEDFRTNPELYEKFEFLNTLKKQREEAKNRRDFMVSAATQKLLKQYEVQSKEQARTEYRNQQDKLKKQKAEDKAILDKAKKIAKDTPVAEVTPITPVIPVVADDPVVDDKIEGSIEIKPIVPTKTVAAPVDNAVTDKIDQLNVIKATLEPLTTLQKDIFNNIEIQLNNLLKILADDTNKYSRAQLDGILDKLSVLPRTITKNEIKDNTVRRNIKQIALDTNDLAILVIDLYNTGTDIIDDASAIKEDEVLSAFDEEEQNTFGEEEEIKRLENNEEVSEEPIILSTENVGSLTTSERFQRGQRAVENLTNLLQKYTAMGYPIESFDDLERQLYKMTSKDNIIKLRPQLIKMWNALMDIQGSEDLKVSPTLYRETDTISDNEYFEKAYLGENWTEDDEASVQNLTDQMVINNNALANSPIVTVDENGTSLKSLSSFNLAYLAKDYEIIEKVDGTRVVRKKQDAGDDLNETLDTRVLDVDDLLAGSKLFFSPLRVGQSHSYYNKAKGVEVVLTRLDNDNVREEEFYLTAEGKTLATTPKVLSAIDYLPIFISSNENSNNPKRIPGLFLHTTDWVNTSAIAGTENEVEIQQQLLRDVRNTIINNKTGKLLSTEVQQTSDGVFLTSTEKPVSRVTEKQKPIITILDATDPKGVKLKSNRTQEEFVSNNKFVNNAKGGTAFMVVKNGKNKIAIPLKRKKLKDLEEGENIKNTIVKLVDVYLTPANLRTDEQNELRRVFKNELKINLNNIKDVNDYISMFINTENIKSNDLEQINKVVAKGGKTDGSTMGVPVFKFKYFNDVNDTLFLFGRYGDKEMSIINSNENNVEDRAKLINYLNAVLNDTYMTVSIEKTVNRKEVKVLDNDNRSFSIGENYSDFLANNLFTNSAPATITTANGKEKEIFTVQRTITVGEPINESKKVLKREVKENKVVEQIIEEPIVEKSADDEALDFLNSFGDMDSANSLFALDEEEDSTFGNEPGDNSENTEDYIINEEVYSLEDEYNFIKGINTNLLNSVLNKVKFNIEDSVFSDNKISADKAFENVVEDINQFIGLELYPNIRKTLLNPDVSDEVKEKTDKFHDDLLLQVENIKSNKDVIISRVQNTINKEGFFKSATPAQIEEYNQGIKEKRRLEAEAADKERINGERTSAEVVPSLGDEDSEIDTDNLSNTEADTTASEIVDYSEFDSDGMYVDTFTTLNDEVKSFFTRIRNMKADKTPARNFFGIEEYISPGDAYRKVQELLINHPSQPFKTPDYDSYIAILEQEQKKIPYLYDVVQKLKNEARPAFKKAFVKGMYKQYNNTVLVLVDNKGNTRIVNSDASNVLRYSKEKWLANFDLNTSNTIIKGDQDIPTKELNPVFKDRLDYLYNETLELASAKNPNITKLTNNIKEVFQMIGIVPTPAFFYDLMNGGVLHYNNPLSPVNFVRSSLFTYSIGSVVGNPALDLPAITNLYENDLYHNSSFNSLANLLGTYDSSLYGSSSKDINNNTIYNASEMKNVVEAFYRNRDNLDWIKASMVDPYRTTPNFDKNKKYKTWAEQLINIDAKGEVTLNPSSSFSKTFEYFTFNGTEFANSKGKERFAVENLSEVALFTNNFNMFFKGNTLTENGRTIRTGHIPFFTMSDKKVPLYLKVPLEAFDIALLSPKLTNTIQKKAEAGSLTDEKRIEDLHGQRELLFNSLLRPELNRINSLFKNNAIDEINIQGYDKTNLKFYGMPYLNTLDFRYIDGIVENGIDEQGKLLSDLGLVAGENLFIETDDRTAPKQLNPDVLNKDTVQQFLMDKVIANLYSKFQDLRADLVTKDLISYNENMKDYVFNDNKNLDLASVMDGYKAVNPRVRKDLKTGDKLKAVNALVDYIINSAVAYANMQQMLVGDPIQFADSKTSSKTLRNIKSLNNKLIELETSKEDSKIVQEQRDNLNRQIDELRTTYEEQWNKTDVVNTFNNQGKRLAGDNASGEIILASETKPNFNLLIVDDHNVSSDFIDYYKDIFKKAGYSDEQAESFVDGYRGIDAADAQELTTLNEHLDILQAQGALSPQEAQEIRKSDEDGNMSIKQYGQILTSMKLVYSNNFMRDGINSRLYIKSSSFPLAKTFTKGLPIDDLRKLMEKENIDRVAFKSAIKVGSTKTVPQVFKEDGSLDLSTIDTAAHVISVPREGHKKQQNVPYDEDKTKISDGTQKSKLIFVNILDTPGFKHPDNGKAVTGRVLYEDYIDTFNEYYQRKYFKLKDKITVDNKVNLPRLHALLEQEAINRNYSLNDMKFLQLNDTKDGFAYPLWLSSNQEKIEALLNSIVDNGIRKRKRRGMSKVLVTDSIIDITRQADSNIIFLDKEPRGALRPMRIDEESGEVLPAEIIVTFPYKDNYGRTLDINDFLKEDGTIDSEKLPNELLESLAFRIPTQGINSMAVVKIVGFLPANVDNVVFAPKDFVAQMGSDFDVDKLYGDLQNTVYNSTNGSLRKLIKEDYEKNKETRKFINKQKEIESITKAIENDSDNIELNKRRTTKLKYLNQELEAIRNGRTDTEMLEEYFNGVNELDIKYLENRMLDFQKAVLLNPHTDVQAQRIQPIDNSEMIKIKNKILPAVFSEEVADNWSAYDPLYQLKKYKGARAGKSGVSTFSSDSILNAVLQAQNKPIHFTNMVKGEKMRVTFKLFGKKSNALNDPNTISADALKSDIIQALQSISVDNEKLQMMDKLNITSKTFDFIRAAVQSGYGVEDVFYIINHPIIKAFTESQDNNTNFALPYASADNINGYMGIAADMTHEEVEDDIFKGTVDFNNKRHLAVYYAFAQVTNRGKQLKQIESLLSIDSTGLGSNLFYSLEKERSFEELPFNPYFSNIGGIIGDYRPTFEQISANAQIVANKDNSKEDKKIYDAAKEEHKVNNQNDGYVTGNDVNYWFKPTTIAGIVSWRALKFNNKLWESILPYNKPHITNITDFIADLERNKKVDIFTDKDVNDDLKVRLNTIKDYRQKNKTKDFISDVSVHGISEVKQKAVKEYKAFLFSSIGELDGTTAKDLRTKLYTDNYLANIITTIQNQKLLPNNRLIAKLNFRTISRGNNMLNITFNSSAKESFDEETLLMDMISLIESPQSIVVNGEVLKVKDIAKMLIQHQMINGGLQEAVQFIKYIPIPYLHNIGLYNKMNDATFQQDNEDVFLEQYIQHHPETVYSEGLKTDLETPGNRIYNYDVDAGIITKVGSNKQEDYSRQYLTQDSYVSIKSLDGTYSLFKRSPFNADTFLRIPVLGKPTIREYDASANVGTLLSAFGNDSKSYPGAHISNYKEMLIKGYQLTDVNSELKRLLALGEEDPENPDAIIKECK